MVASAIKVNTSDHLIFEDYELETVNPKEIYIPGIPDLHKTVTSHLVYSIFQYFGHVSGRHTDNLEILGFFRKTKSRISDQIKQKWAGVILNSSKY